MEAWGNAIVHVSLSSINQIQIFNFSLSSLFHLLLALVTSKEPVGCRNAIKTFVGIPNHTRCETSNQLQLDCNLRKSTCFNSSISNSSIFVNIFIILWRASATSLVDITFFQFSSSKISTELYFTLKIVKTMCYQMSFQLTYTLDSRSCRESLPVILWMMLVRVLHISTCMHTCGMVTTDQVPKAVSWGQRGHVLLNKIRFCHGSTLFHVHFPL